MQKATFDQMIKNLDSVVKQCDKLAKMIPNTEAFNQLPYGEVGNIVNHAKGLMGQQDRILNAELYHVLGMGELTASQESKFIRLIKELGKTRSLIKCLACFPIPEAAPVIPVKSDYKCNVLGVALEASWS